MIKQNQIMRIGRPILKASNLKAKAQQGMALLESMIAIVIFSMGILALAGLQSVLVKSTSDAKYRAEATFIAQQRLGLVWVGSGDLADSAEVDTDISDLLPNGTRTVSISPERVVTVTVSWQLPGEDEHTYSANARVEGI
ncbi:type IV pilus modification PilV family protein [Methylotenera mobilis]|jgi:type IV pilus assembly protein PilV|uniref:type IV pilus modification PilV family protein n=1 Tax=Methylotenera mobilis TaxID=359408 RepID=UPI0003674106|nr:prepilin-type N-terminal cleavage/methylation domain-containing protein [Methylotenera mobilis]